MLNYLWAFMMVAGVLWAAFHGNLSAVTDGALSSAKEAVMLCITMLGVMALWTGIMEIGERAGLIRAISKKMRPLMRFLFPRIPENHPSLRYISTNFVANILGLGWAATPAGLEAMKSLAEINPEKEGIASREMCTFLIVNISSLQLIPINMIAYRSQYGSVNPAAIAGPALLATIASTAAGIAFCKVMDRKNVDF